MLIPEKKDEEDEEKGFKRVAERENDDGSTIKPRFSKTNLSRCIKTWRNILKVFSNSNTKDNKLSFVIVYLINLQLPFQKTFGHGNTSRKFRSHQILTDRIKLTNGFPVPFKQKKEQWI